MSFSGLPILLSHCSISLRQFLQAQCHFHFVRHLPLPKYDQKYDKSYQISSRQNKRVANPYNKKPRDKLGALSYSRQRPTLPPRYQGSTIGAGPCRSGTLLNRAQLFHYEPVSPAFPMPP